MRAGGEELDRFARAELLEFFTQQTNPPSQLEQFAGANKGHLYLEA